MSHDLEVPISVNLVLEAAHRLFSYDKVPLALALLHVVLEQHPEHPNARKFYQMFTGISLPDNPVARNHRVYSDSDTGMIIVMDKSSGKSLAFKTFEEAHQYLRDLK